VKYLLLIVTLLLCSCAQNTETPFQSNELAHEKEAPVLCHFNPSTQRYESPANPITQSGYSKPLYYAEGGGCINRPLRTVWAVSQSLLGLKLKNSDIETIRRLELEGADFVFQTDHKKQPLKPFPPTIRWTLEWRHWLKEGTFQTPLHLAIEYQKVKSHPGIKHWWGMIHLVEVAPNVTSFSMRNEYHGSRENTDKVKNMVRDLFDNFQRQLPN